MYIVKRVFVISYDFRCRHLLSFNDDYYYVKSFKMSITVICQENLRIDDILYFIEDILYCNVC